MSGDGGGADASSPAPGRRARTTARPAHIRSLRASTAWGGSRTARRVYFLMPRAPYGGLAEQAVVAGGAMPAPAGRPRRRDGGRDRQSRHVVLGGLRRARQAQAGGDRARQRRDRRLGPARRADREASGREKSDCDGAQPGSLSVAFRPRRRRDHRAGRDDAALEEGFRSAFAGESTWCSTISGAAARS